MSGKASEHGKVDFRRARGRELTSGMTLFDAEDQPRQILEISDYRQHAHPEVSEYRMARCSGGWAIMVSDKAICRISHANPAGEAGPANEGASR